MRKSAAVGAATWVVPSVISTAPVAAAVGSCQSSSIYEFASGLEDWTIDNSFGVGSLGWWTHNAEPSRGGGSLHYGQGTAGDYDRGASRNGGSVTSAHLALPASGGNIVRFTVWRSVEAWSNNDYDVLRFSVLGTPNAVLWSAGSDGGTAGVFETHQVSIPAAYDGQDVRFRFDFDTVDGQYNNFEGIYIGRFYVTACPTVGVVEEKPPKKKDEFPPASSVPGR